MPRVNTVDRARQRYAMVPKTDEEGNALYTEQTKKGKTFRRALTVQDRTRPLPNLRCDFPGCAIDGGEILVGKPYKFITVRPGGRGSVQKNRHPEHPSWQPWEYSNSVRAEAARLVHDMGETVNSYEFTAEEDFDSLRDELAEQAQAFLDEREEAVDNMPEGLQDGSEAAEYRDSAEEWVQEIENADSPDEEYHAECEDCEEGKVECDSDFHDGTDQGEEQCPECGGTDTNPEDVDCASCDGTGRTEEVNEDWAEAAREALQEAVDSLQI
jgi:hypothetical protein